MTDPLTTLFNRRYFDGALEMEVGRSRRYSVPLALLMLDLDFFKSVNDIYGHVFGDQVLRRAGHVVRRAVRESDLACRFGGDEFAVILPQTERIGAYVVADRIRRRIEADFTATPIDGRVTAITISGGLSACPEDAATPELLIDCADRALYHSKSCGKNGIVIHHIERRSAMRFPVKPSTRAELSAGPALALAPVHTLNLSRGGALLRAEADELPVGPVELTLWEEDDRWSIAARVVRVEDRSAEGWRTFAVAFDRPLPDPCLRRSVLYTPLAPPRAEGAA
jgi:diguanylate cyclase (GGDEF)-like protein